MKVGKALGHFVTILAFLILGSMLIIISLHMYSLDDALMKVREIYARPFKSLQIGLFGLLLIALGLAYIKQLVKMGPDNDALLCQNESGPVVISGKAIEDLAKKVARKNPFVRDVKSKLNLRPRRVEIKLRLSLWSGVAIGEVLGEIQNEVRAKLSKLLGELCQVEVTCDVHRIDEPGDASNLQK